MKKDYHIHTQYSYDSSIEAIALLNKAIAHGYSEIAITEHLDLLPQELRLFGLPSLVKYQEYILRLREDFPNLKLHMGIEIGDYHHVKDLADGLISGFDFYPILGSVHFLRDQTNVAIPLPAPLSENQIRDYYEQNLNLVSLCDIHVLSHLGVYKRYYRETPDERAVHPVMRQIFEVMIQKGIALELNFSGYRKPYGNLLPEPEVLQIYTDMGGRLFTLGSDAHHLDHFDDFYDLAMLCLPAGAILL
ncbi:MAG TPA: histidinol-phosphatase HisJ family protein [Candidatus Cloacimonadota bacterium]|nr:histidinol-phosphatase HisJ family protein [Candidatus Cloacimonadota bacterium]